MAELVINSELAQGNLDEYVKNYDGYLEEAKILRIFTQILLGMHTLQINNIDHRDLKPANILVYNDGAFAKLADLGLARYFENSEVSRTHGIGTLSFWAPELLKNKPVQSKSDMYSLGLILYFMMTKSKPNYEDIIEKGDLMLPGQYSQEINEICEWLLQVNPEDRPMVREVIGSDIIIQEILRML